VVLLLSPAQRIPVTGVLVAARDLPAGSVLGAADVTVREVPTRAIPDGAAETPGTVLGRVLAAPVRRGEPLTDVRLAGPELTRAVSMTPEAVSVPLRLADPGVAVLLRPGLTVDVVTVGQREGEPVLLARGARVLAVLGASSAHRSGDGRLVLVALEPLAATRVAAASLSQTLTVTLH
jgi:Flp pilus assembly protein CpaB